MSDPVQENSENKFPNTADLFLRKGLYDPIHYSRSDSERLIRFVYFDGTVDMFCTNCNSSATFRANNAFLENYRTPMYDVPNRPTPNPLYVPKDELTTLLKIVTSVDQLVV